MKGPEGPEGLESIPLRKGDEPLKGNFIQQEREVVEREKRERAAEGKEKVCPKCGGSLAVLTLEGEERYSCAKDGTVIPDQEEVA